MSKKVKIIVLIVIAAVLVITLLGVISNNNVLIPFGKFFQSQSMAQGEKQSSFETDLQGIRNIKFNFVCEGINVVTTNENKIRIEETSDRTMNKNDMMECSVNSDTLLADSGLHDNNFSFLSWLQYGNINVTLYVPASYVNNFDLYSVSGMISMQDVQGSVIKLSSVSGEIAANHIQSDEVDLDNVSGAINLDAQKVKTINGKSVSGGMHISLIEMPSQIQLNNVSGGVRLELPENDGFTLHTKSVSGGINNDFAMANGVYKDGKNSIGVETVSGGINIIKQ